MLRNGAHQLGFIEKIHHILRTEDHFKLRGFPQQINGAHALLELLNVGVDALLLFRNLRFFLFDVRIQRGHLIVQRVDLALHGLHLSIQRVLILLLLGLVCLQLFELGRSSLLLLFQLALLLLQLIDRGAGLHPRRNT